MKSYTALRLNNMYADIWPICLESAKKAMQFATWSELFAHCGLRAGGDRGCAMPYRQTQGPAVCYYFGDCNSVLWSKAQ